MGNLINKSFGNIVIIDEYNDKNRKTNKQRVKCQCICGNIFEAYKGHMISGSTKSCGCLLKQIKLKNRNLIGQKFGMLTIISFEDVEKYGTKNTKLICKCECGNIKSVYYTSLKKGKTTSCGCRKDQYEKITGKNSSQFSGYEQISGMFWTKIKLKAKERNIPFEISIEYAWSLFKKQDGKCALTNVPIKFGKSNTDEFSASLDRIDNNKGYIEGNVQWIYKSINIMKNSYSLDHFIEVCLLVAKNNGWQPIDQNSKFSNIMNLSEKSLNEKRPAPYSKTQ